MLRILARFAVVVLTLSALGIGLVDYLKNIDENECSMTYMKQPIHLIPVPLEPSIAAKFPYYKLILYCEGYFCHDYAERLRFTRASEIPVLFITGNADSHKQVRSLASVAAYKALKNKYSRRAIRFLYFTIDFDEQLSALYGPILHAQTEFARHCVKHILSLFEGVEPREKRPQSVLVIGNSMGGLVARGLFLPSSAATEFNPAWVNTIITQASPHTRPVLNVDKKMSDFYERVNSLWLNPNQTGLDHVVLVSLYGGVRDILVRSGLANVNEWRNRSGATVLSTYTVSMPNVWRSIDHRCMVWCRELVMAINRALFELIDPKTGQLVQDRYQRERVLRRYFERDFMLDDHQDESSRPPLRFEQTEINRIVSDQDAFFSWNDFNSKNRLVVFDLDSLLSSFDSLFLYTNINAPNTVVACKNLGSESDANTCENAHDLLSLYGQAIPPYIEELKDQGLKTMNLNNLRGQLLDKGYKHLVVAIPVLPESDSKYQLVFKIDWYRQEERFKTLKKSPIEGHQLEWAKNDAATFRRYYLNSFRSVWQAFELVNKAKLDMTSASAKLRPLMASNVVVQFHEPVSHLQAQNRIEHVYHSHAIQGKTKNLTLRLTANHYQSDLTPYIDVIKFDPEHVVAKKWSTKRLGDLDSTPQIEIEFNVPAMLGQLVRFYLPLVPAFLVAILQMYDLVLILLPESSDELHSVFLLNKLHSNMLSHLVFSYVLGLLGYLVPYFGNDFELLKFERTDHFLLPFFLYWTAYALLNAVSFFMSINYGVISFVVHRIVAPLLSCLNFGLARGVGFFAHLVFACVAGYFASALVNCVLFYTMIIQLAIHNPRYSKPPFDHIRHLNRQTRSFFLYVLFVLNLPSIIVWAKALSSGQGEIRPLNSMMGDTGFFVAFVNLFIFLIYEASERSYGLKSSYFSINIILLASLVVSNSLLTVLYSTVSLYRLQYFVCMHLFFMCFMPRKALKIKAD